MRKAVFALLAVFALVASIAAAQVASPVGLKAADLNVAKNVAPASAQVSAFGLKADKSQCMCSADTLAKIEQIRKILADLEQSCMIVENPGRTPPSQPSFSSGECVDKCMADQNAVNYCKKSCLEPSDEGCYDGCYAGMKQKCENSCNVGGQKPAEQPGCTESCVAKNFNKEECLKPCYDANGVMDDACYNECSTKAGVIWDKCQKECAGSTSTQPAGQIDNCVLSCDKKYAECKDGCYATGGVDFPKVEQCVKDNCMPLRNSCVSSCNQQYKKEETFVQKIVSVFKPVLNKAAKWECHDGTAGESTEICKPSADFEAKAKAFCDGKCSAETNKCGVNSFYVYGEC
ncbi:MAG TPA: hypothetical protein HA362_07070 [Nanoarchaeota archaeon]|nr:hypothetical protein [Nanoarchaeota archaeon]